MLDFLSMKFVKKLHFKLFEAPRGLGAPQSVDALNESYLSGEWDFLDSIDEMANYMVVVGYVQYLAKRLQRKPRILDLGCGSGNLIDLLSGVQYEKYLGLDSSSVAVERALNRKFENAEFMKTTFEQWETDEKFDFIISTGAIHYAKKPQEVLMRYSNFLSDDGVFVISLWRHGFSNVIWKKIEAHFAVIDSTVVINHKKQDWDVKVLRANQNGGLEGNK